MSFIENLNWRNATKGFDSTKQLDASLVEKILSSIRLAPTSFGLQPFHIDVVTDQKTKDAIMAVGWKQPQYSTCSHLLVFSTLAPVSKRITDFIQLMSQGDPAKAKALAGYEQMMRSSLEPRSTEELHQWAAKQAYIALGFAMAACAELKVDSCPMEGFDPPSVDKIMGYSAQQRTVVMLPIGRADAKLTPRPKTRFPDSDLFTKR